MQRKIECQYDGCRRKYCSYFNLKRHIESSHMGLRKFKCDICGKNLSSKQNSIDHQNKHTGEKPYKCSFPDCNEAFRQLSQYYIHKQLHTMTRMHPASITNCHNRFISFLTEKFGEEPKLNSNIQLLPLSTSNVQLPKITQPGEFSLPQFLLP